MHAWQVNATDQAFARVNCLVKKRQMPLAEAPNRQPSWIAGPGSSGGYSIFVPVDDTRHFVWPESQGTDWMEKKIFWGSFFILGLAADLFLPFWWALAATIPIGIASWWIAYRSDWFQ